MPVTRLKISKLNWIFLVLVVLFCLRLNEEYYIYAQSNLALKDDHIEIIIEIEGQNIQNAVDKENAIQIHPTGDIYGKLICKIIGNDTIYIDKVKIGFVIIDRDVFSNEMDINVSLNSGDELRINQTFTFQDVLGLETFSFVSGIYNLKYYLYYSFNASSEVLEGQPFYMNIIGNPLTSVTGIVSTAAVAYAGVTTVGLINSMSKSIPREIGNSIDNSSVKATQKLKSFYEAKSFKSLQNEVSKSAFGYAKVWKAGKCPSCNIEWPDGEEVCPGCHITVEESQEIYAKTLEQKSLNVCEEIINSASTLSVYGIAQNIGAGTIPTTSIVSVLINSGLSIAQPRMGKSWNAKTRKLVFKGLSTALTSVLWVQAIGFEVISLSMLAVALLTATVPALIISKILENMIKVKTKLFWGSKIVVT